MNDKILSEVKSLFSEAEILLKGFDNTAVNVITLSSSYNKWYSQALPVVRQLTPERLKDFENCFSKTDHNEPGEPRISVFFAEALVNPETREYYQKVSLGYFSIQHGIIAALELRLTSVLGDIRSVLQADMFDSELDAAKELLENGHIRAAGCVAGVVLEGHLKNLCIKHTVVISQKNPSLSDYYQELYKKKIIDNSQRSKLEYLGTIRNYCSHKKEREPTEQEVSELIDETHKTTKVLI